MRAIGLVPPWRCAQAWPIDLRWHSDGCTGVSHSDEEAEMTVRLSALLTGLVALAVSAAQAADKPPIKIGLLEDQSGEVAPFTIPKVHGTQLAVEEINKAGGIA